MIRRIDQRAAGFHRVGDDGREIHGSLLQIDLAAGDARDVHQVIDQPHHVTDLAIHDLVGGHRGLARSGEAQQTQRVADGREGIAQLVRQRGEEPVLALVGLLALLEMRPRLVLPGTGAQRAAHGTHQRRDANRPLEQRDVAERLPRSSCHLRIGAGTRKKQDRKVGPRGLSGEQRREPTVVPRERLLGNDDGGRAPLDLEREVLQVAATDAESRFRGQRRRHERRILPDRRQDEQPALESRFRRRAHVLFAFSGTPVRTPRKPRSGSPMVMRPFFMLKSRMLRSCSPPRILTTEIACLTSPSDSK